jgi:hypothetical protein
MSVIEARYGLAQCFALVPHLAYLTDGLGTHWEILANTYKPFPCGIVIHPLIEAALEIAQELNTAAEAVARVEIIANPAAHGALLPPTPKGRDGGACQPLPLGGSGFRAGARPAYEQLACPSGSEARHQKVTRR